MDPTTQLAPRRSVDQRQLSWLRREVADWQSEGVIDASQATAITTRYRVAAEPDAKSTLGRILLWLGGGFVGIGLIWLVAANLEQLSPLTRFVAVVALWLAFLVGSEVLAARQASRPLTGAIRLLAALAFGAMLFQAAQSLQVPAFEPRLIGVWAAGALLHGYLTRAVAPFVVGLAAGIGWWIAQPLITDGSGLGAVVALGSGAVLAASLAVLHDLRGDVFAWWWRLVGAGMALNTLFAAAIPGIHDDRFTWSAWLVSEAVVAGVAAAVALALAARRERWSWVEPVGAGVVLLGSVLLTLWDTGSDATDVGPGEWAHAGLSVLAYVALAVGIVVLAAMRGHPALTWIAMSALVVFTTFQSFAVFAPIVTGAWLFVVLGTVFLGTGFLFDRARRELTHALDSSQEGADR